SRFEPLLNRAAVTVAKFIFAVRQEQNLDACMLIRAPQTRSAFHPHAQRNAFRRRDVRQQRRSFALPRARVREALDGVRPIKPVTCLPIRLPSQYSVAPTVAQALSPSAPRQLFPTGARPVRRHLELRRR